MNARISSQAITNSGKSDLSDPLPQTDRRFRVLLIEDNLDDREMMAMILGKCGWEIDVQLACDGVEALELLEIETEKKSFGKGGPPDLVVCDLKMPRLMGDEVLTLARRTPHTKAIPLVMFTSSALDTDVNKCMRLGATAYCVKPVDYDAFASCLLATVQRWVGNSPLQPDCMVECSKELA